jgi:hypothetical protein
LDQSDVQGSREVLTAGTKLPDTFGRHIQKARKPIDPLFEELLAMDEY